MIYRPSIIDAVKDAAIVVNEASNNFSSYFGTYSTIYHITTECSSTYINAMGDNFKTALTIGASADQGIALNRKGAENIYFFDLNRVDFYFIMLKKVALETLKRKDFLEFMIAENTGEIMDYRLYTKIKDRLDIATRAFWDAIYNMFGYNSYLISIYLFRNTKKNAEKSKLVNDYYINNQSYYETQEKVKTANWHFIESDFYDLDKNLPDGINFDAIVLSNIYEYLNFGQDVSRENALRYLNFIKDILLPRLNQGGACMSAYIYRYDEQVNEFIKGKLQKDPNNWAQSSQFLKGLDTLENYFAGYTGQNVAYHYLYEAFEQEPGIQKVKTKAAGFGMSSANNDLAIIQKK